MANELKFNSKVVFSSGSPITLPIASADPGSAVSGDLYFNSTSNHIKCYISGAWHVIQEDAISALTGDVSASGPGSAAATVNSVGGSSAANVHSAELAANAATSANTPSTIVKRDSSGNFSAGTITASLTGSASNNVLKAGDTMSGVLNMGGNLISSVADPVGPQDAATKFYTDNLVAGLSWKQYARVASIGSNISISSAPAAIDGVTLSNGDRILLKDQTSAPANGIYIFNGAGSALTRSTDADTWSEIVNAVLLVSEGSVNMGSKWVNTNIAGGTLGTNNVTFVAFSVAGTVNGTGTSGYVTYWSGTATLTAEQYLSAARGGLATDASAFTGVVKASSGVFSASTIVNADVNASAAIAYSKLALSNSIVNADINASAAIAYSKLALSNSIVNADIASGAAIALNKLAALTNHNRALQSDGSGFISESAVTSTELGYLSGVTSAIQTQLNGKASTSLNNLASTAVNADIVAASNNSINLGSASFNYAAVNSLKLLSNAAMLINVNAGASALNIESSAFARSTDGTNYVTETYSDSSTLTDNSGPTAVAAFQFAVASFAGEEISYVIETGTSNVETRIGTLRITANSSGTIVPSISDMFTESADCGVSWTATNSAGTISIKYTCSNQGANRTMRADIKSFRR